MTLSSELEFALLSLDSYNRGYNPGIPGLSDAPGTQVGNWTILDTDLPTGSEAASFYAAAYQDASGNIVISYSGTDNPTIGADLTAWTGGAGFQTEQAELAARLAKGGCQPTTPPNSAPTISAEANAPSAPAKSVAPNRLPSPFFVPKYPRRRLRPQPRAHPHPQGPTANPRHRPAPAPQFARHG